MRCGFPTTPFQKSKKTHNKVEIIIVRHGPVTLLPQERLRLAYLLAYLFRRGAYEKVWLDQAWSCGRDARISVRGIRRRRRIRRSCLSAATAPEPLCLQLDRILCRCSC